MRSRGRGHAYTSLYPADGSVSAELHAASADDATEAVERAHDAFLKSGWASAKPHERATVLYRVAEAIRNDRERLAHLQRRDNGKPIGETRALVDSAAGTFQFMAAACETLEDQLTPMRGRTREQRADPKPPSPQAPADPQPRPKVAAQATKPRKMASPLTVGDQPGGIDSATWQRFRTGKLLATKRLDLHVMTAQRAFHALVAFLRTAHAEQVRCVEVVTGRGSGSTPASTQKHNIPVQKSRARVSRWAA